MATIKNQIQNIINRLTVYEEELKKDPTPIETTSFVSKKTKNNEYFYKLDNEKKGGRIYVGNAKSEKFKRLIQAAYKFWILKIIKKDIQVLTKALNDLIPYDNAHIIGHLSPCVRDLPFQYSFNTCIGKLYSWAKEEYEHNPLPFPDRIILAEDGTRVRSKSECIIYNMLLAAGIPFRYDPLLEFTIINAYGQKETITKSPDFQIILPDGSFILIEHAGLLSSHKYVTDLAEKLQIYQLNNYILGYTLFVTSDTIDGGIDSKQINKIIEIISSHYIELQ